MLKRSSNKAADENKPQAYPLRYVEDLGELRTTLETSFTVRLPEEGHYC